MSLKNIPDKPINNCHERPSAISQTEIAIKETEIVADRLKDLLWPLEITDSVIRISPALPSPTSTIFDIETLVQIYQGNAVLITSLKQSAEMDALTGLYNKKTGTEKATKAFNQAKETLNEDEAFCFMFLDIDDFGHFNKVYHSQVGDIVLRFVATCLKDVLRKNKGQFTYRFGGEEFGIIIPKLILATSYQVPVIIYQDYLELFVERRSELLAEIMSTNPTVMPPDDMLVTLSVGAYLIDKENIQHTNFNYAKGQADAAQVCVKAKGKNQVQIIVNATVQI